MRADVAAAWLAARAAGEAQGLTMCLADGKRSRAQQQATYDDYVAQLRTGHGRPVRAAAGEVRACARAWRSTCSPTPAYTWLEGTNGALGFCRIYDNEAWHFEYDPQFTTAGCPARLPHPGA